MRSRDDLVLRRYRDPNIFSKFELGFPLRYSTEDTADRQKFIDAIRAKTNWEQSVPISIREIDLICKPSKEEPWRVDTTFPLRAL